MTIASSESHGRDQGATTATVSETNSPSAKPVKRAKRRSTSHLKAVPETLELRESMRDEAERFVERLDKSKPFNKGELEAYGHELLKEINQPEKFLGFVMVLIGNFYWKRQFLALPFDRRLLLLPHCLKHAEGCPADYDEFGLDCEKCGACSIADYKVRAEQLGYKVLVAEGSPIVLKIIVSGHVDGILGVACLNVLEKAIDKVLVAGVPSYAVPLHTGDCKNTTLDESWIWDCLEKYEPLPEPQTNGYIPLMRASNRMFEEQFDELVPPIRSTGASTDVDSPLASTEAISYDWLAHGGKRLRPFITLAAYDAVSGSSGLAAGFGDDIEIPVAVRRGAIAIEAFHKASLAHDDIEDDDLYRYGQETLHRRYGTGMAINVGDYLIGLGYRLVSRGAAELGGDVVADVLDSMAKAHIKLCDGQGAEMRWQANGEIDLTPIDALKIYALKTSPAFEAALFAGLRMGGAIDEYREMIPAFCRHLGVGFQILNDLKDWQGDDDNKLIAGQDALSLRPTLLLALALEAADTQQRSELEEILTGEGDGGFRLGRLRRIYDECGVFEKAHALVEKSRARAEALADDVQPDALRQLLYFMVDTVLAEESLPQSPATTVLAPLPILGTVGA